MLESSFEGYAPVIGEPPTRQRTTPNPLSLDEYTVRLVSRTVMGGGTSDDSVR